MRAVGLYFYNIFHSLYTVIVGMKITFSRLFARSVTIQYPTVKKNIPERGRNRLYVNIDDCIGCKLCAIACPVDCITIETIKSTPDVDLGFTSKKTRKQLYIPQFDIDMAKCCYCGMCVPPCPTECIVMTDVYEFSEYKLQNLVYSFSNMTEKEITEARERLIRFHNEQAAKKASSPAKQVQPFPPKPEPKPIKPEMRKEN